ncbi:hydrolase 1, exosortase A system-associated [Undibacterium sp. Jales W-56]|uniref:hydrolase 1, exosortase A system-associated n=1 Tax=Undibacterium sp. Jales W-56 TaxID=2897325 RepID=UPI0021CF087E|nr:hydrolase 1, exosortase A system-associated [Undibacterium sp. Jales W-56]MCU6434153.1 hydrolase 1, exosortase A system-associated [Undibacterium sp. Jales W-56]
MSQDTAIREKAVGFRVAHDMLYGVISQPLIASQRGVLFIVGGPQYRAGSHRQFTLLARDLALNGVSAMRFDYRGMGDSEGEVRDFLTIHDDIRAAIDYFCMSNPHLSEIVLWGLCDGASAAVLYAARDRRVKGMILINPWVRTEAGNAKAYLKHYYKDRLIDPQVWEKILHGQFNYRTAVNSLLNQLKQVLKIRAASKGSKERDHQPDLPGQILAGMQQFKGKSLFILSENDLTAREFADVLYSSKEWKKITTSSQNYLRHLKGADHTFSQKNWRDQVASWSTDWLNSW